MPRDERDLVIAAKANLVVALDNVSYLPQWLSDALCRMATGSGWATRRLYTDADEELFSQSRPVLITGIEDYVANGDLLDRSMLINLPTIAPAERRQEAELEREFDRLQPLVLGAIFDAVSTALRNIQHVASPNLPRMADFAAWVLAAEESLPWNPGSFIDAFRSGAHEAQAVILEASPVSEPLAALARSNEEGWCGTAAELLRALNDQVPDDTRRSQAWPKTGRGLAGAVRRLAPTLRAVGISVEFDREPNRSRRRLILLRQQVGEPNVHNVQPSMTQDDVDGLDDVDGDFLRDEGNPLSDPPAAAAAAGSGTKLWDTRL
jgi:hypothetical protein